MRGSNSLIRVSRRRRAKNIFKFSSGCEIGRNAEKMDGKIYRALLRQTGCRLGRVGVGAFDAADEKAIEESLRGLGYIQ